MSRAIAAVLALTTAAAATACTPEPSGGDVVVMGVGARVTAVVDGDTIDVRVAEGMERVRIIGLDTPELGRDGAADECYAQEARAYVDDALAGRTVTLFPDPTQDDVDQYGRLLRHVYVDERSIALGVIEDGAGREFTFDEPYGGQEAHLAAQDAARDDSRGLWGACDRSE